jgi:microcystin-dependent protein
MAGFWYQSNTQIHDPNGRPFIGARAYFYKGGTTTPITVYKSFDLGSINAHPNPLMTYGNGFWPPVYFDEADEFFRVRITTSQGVLIVDADGIPIVGPAGGGGGGSTTPVDPDAVSKTGDLKHRYGEGFVPGWTRCNGRTIGSATSGATERANSDTQALFEFLWNADPNLAVVGGRGATALADWSANKQLTLPDMRGRTLVGLDIMGNVAANVLVYAAALGWAGGVDRHVLTIAEMPSHTHTGSTSADGYHQHLVPTNNNNDGGPNAISAGDTGPNQFDKFTDGAGLHTHTLTTDATGGGAAHNNLQPSMAVTIYIRL